MEQADIQQMIIRQSMMKCATDWICTCKQSGENVTDVDITKIAKGFVKWVNKKPEVKIDLPL